ncbi:MAG: hypothetical protein ACFWTN_02975 [Clostridium sp.]|jgi:CheY-like chemotaxis protein
MAGERVLIIDDDRNSVRFLQLELEHEGYRVEKEYDGLQGLQRAKQEQFDIILLDIMLPGMDGMKVLHKIRQISDTPVIMLTAKDAVSDKVQGLDGGADETVCHRRAACPHACGAEKTRSCSLGEKRYHYNRQAFGEPFRTRGQLRRTAHSTDQA